MQLTNGRSAGRRTRHKSSAGYATNGDAAYISKRGARIIDSGRARIVEINGGQLWLESQLPPEAGAEIELAVRWPAPSGSAPQLILHIQGRTMERRGSRTRVEIGQYDFRTASGTEVPLATLQNAPKDLPAAPAPAAGCRVAPVAS